MTQPNDRNDTEVEPRGVTFKHSANGNESVWTSIAWIAVPTGVVVLLTYLMFG